MKESMKLGLIRVTRFGRLCTKSGHFEGNEDSNKIEEFESPNGKRKIVATFEKDFCRIEFQPKSDETGNESSPCSR